MLSLHVILRIILLAVLFGVSVTWCTMWRSGALNANSVCVDCHHNHHHHCHHQHQHDLHQHRPHNHALPAALPSSLLVLDGDFTFAPRSRGYGKTRRKSGLTVGSSLLLWGAIASVCLLLTLWVATVRRLYCRCGLFLAPVVYLVSCRHKPCT